MKEIGGYFELELNKGKEFHSGALGLNSGKNCFEYILRAKQYKKIYIPFYTCEVIPEQCERLGIDYEFYSIDQNLDPIFNKEIKEEEAFLYTNYFGIKETTVHKLTVRIKNLIIDNAQSFFSTEIEGADSFCSARKFFGVPDGAYLYSEKIPHGEHCIDNSTGRFMHLIKRLDAGAEAGYPDFKSNEVYLSREPIKLMSTLTRALLCNINYQEVIKIRIRNFSYLHEHLGKRNKLSIPDDINFVPMVYPFIKDDRGLRDKMIEQKLFVACYWPGVLKTTSKDSWEYFLTENLIPLPIDQRYGIEEMDRIIKLIEEVV